MSLSVEEYEDFIFRHTKRFRSELPTSPYDRLTTNILEQFWMCGQLGPLLAHGIWIWRLWKFGEAQSRGLTFGDYVRHRLRVRPIEKREPEMQGIWRELKAMYLPAEEHV